MPKTNEKKTDKKINVTRACLGIIDKLCTDFLSATKTLEKILKEGVQASYRQFCKDNKLTQKDVQSAKEYRKHLVPLLASKTGLSEKSIKNRIAETKVLPKVRQDKDSGSGSITTEYAINFTLKAKTVELGATKLISELKTNKNLVKAMKMVLADSETFEKIA